MRETYSTRTTQIMTGTSSRPQEPPTSGRSAGPVVTGTGLKETGVVGALGVETEAEVPGVRSELSIMSVIVVSICGAVGRTPFSR